MAVVTFSLVLKVAAQDNHHLVTALVVAMTRPKSRLQLH